VPAVLLLLLEALTNAVGATPFNECHFKVESRRARALANACAAAAARHICLVVVESDVRRVVCVWVSGGIGWGRLC
jgi:hypothetical protein